MISHESGIPADYQGPIGGQSPGNGPPGYDPTDEEQATIKMAEKFFSKAKKRRRAFDEKWLDNYKMFRGKQWKEQRPSYRHSEVINLVFRAIQADVPLLTDGMPRPTYSPTEPGDLEIAEILNNCLESDWNDGNWAMKFTESLYDSHFYGTGFGSIGYDPNASQGAGRIVFKSDDPFYQFPDPSATDVNEESNFWVEAKPEDVDKLKREYPKHAQYIKADVFDLSSADRENFDESTRYKSTSDNRTIIEGNSGGYVSEARNEALKITLYVHDASYCEDEIKSKDPHSGVDKVEYQQRLKYPQGRKIVVVGGVLVEDGPIPYDDKKFPYIRLVNYIDPHSFWGISEVEQLESPQKTFNKLVSFGLDVLTLMGNPIWVVQTDSGVDTDNLYNRPGLIVEPSDINKVRREPGVDLQPSVLQMIDRMKSWFDDMSGQTDVAAGKNPSGVTAMGAIEALQEASQVRIRQKTRNNDAFLQNFGKMYASRALQFYDAPRVFRVTGSDNAQKYFKFHVEKRPVMDVRPVVGPDGMPMMDEMLQPMMEEYDTGEVQKIAKVRDFVTGADGKQYFGEEREYQIQGEFDVRVTTGSSLPFEKNRIEKQSLELFDRQIIDAEEVLKNIKYPNAEAVLARMAEKQAIAAQQEMMAQAPVPPAA